MQGHHCPVANLMTCELSHACMHAVVLVWSWGSSLLGVVVGVYSNGQLPAWIMTVTGGIYSTLGYCLVTKKNDRVVELQQDCCYRWCVSVAVYSFKGNSETLSFGWAALSHLSQHADRPTHLHRHLMTPAWKSVCEGMAVILEVCVCAGVHARLR